MSEHHRNAAIQARSVRSAIGLFGQARLALRVHRQTAAVTMASLLWIVGLGATVTYPGRQSWIASPQGLLVTVAQPVAGSPTSVLSALLFGPRELPLPQQSRLNVTQVGHTGSVAGAITTADTGKPIKRAHVVITAQQPKVARSTITDEQGHYAFRDLPAGRYTISASKPGYFDATFGQKTALHLGTPVTLADGQTLEHVDILLPKGGVITGLLLDEGGDPSPDTPMQALRYDAHTGVKQLVLQASSQTDDRGVYRLHNLPQGDYLVVAVPRVDPDNSSQNGGRAGGGGRTSQTAPDPTPTSSLADDLRLDYVPVYFPGTSSPSAASVISVALGEEKPAVDFQLQLVPAAKLEGSIVGLDGLQGLSSLRLANADGQPGQPRTSGGSTIFGSHFTFTSVAPGRYVIEVRARRVVSNGAPLWLWGDLPVTADGHDQKDLVVTLQEGMTVGGQLNLDPAATGTPPNFASVRVSVAPQGGGPAAGVSGADSSGRFSIQSIVPGDYALSVSSPNGWTAKSVMIDGTDALDFGLHVRASDALPDVRVILTNKSTQLSGTLLDSSGRPAADYTVIVFPTDQRYWVALNRRIQAMRPGTDGTFNIRGLPPGDYLIAAVTDVETGQWYDPALLGELRASGTPVHLVDGEQKIQNLRLAGR